MDWITLIGFVGACGAAASTGAMFPPGKWYEVLDKPSWTPPNWLFPIAWTFLYIAIAVAAWRVSATPSEVAGPALALWACQIAFNAIWTPIFFGKRQLGTAFIAIIGLWLSVLMATGLFFLADTIAGILMVPYLIWVSYAGALNFRLWRMNPDAGLIDLI